MSMVSRSNCTHTTHATGLLASRALTLTPRTAEPRYDDLSWNVSDGGTDRERDVVAAVVDHRPQHLKARDAPHPKQAHQLPDEVTLFQPGPDGITLAAVAQGNATHLGLFSRTESLLLDPVTMTFTGEVTSITADEDQLVASIAGRFVSETTATGTYTFIDGTRRFENATGQAGFVVSSTDGIHFVVTFEGTLNKN